MKHCLAVLVVSFIYVTFVKGECRLLNGQVEICLNFPGNNKYFTENNYDYWTCINSNPLYRNCTAPNKFFNPVTEQCEQNNPNSFVHNKDLIETKCAEHNGIIQIGNIAGIFAYCMGDSTHGYLVDPGLCYDSEGGPCIAKTGNRQCITE